MIRAALGIAGLFVLGLLVMEREAIVVISKAMLK
jgi:hypothetical protein